MAKKRSRKKQRRVSQRIIIGITFLFSSAIILVNNLTQLLQTYNIPLSSGALNTIAFGGGIIAAIWAIILASMGEFS